MARFQVSAIVIITILGILSSTSQSVRFDLQSGHTKCISEDIRSNSMTVGKYSIVNPHDGQPLPESHKLTARVGARRSKEKPMFFVFEIFNKFLVFYWCVGDIELWE